MEFYSFIGVIILFFLVMGLRGRVKKLENIINSGAIQYPAKEAKAVSFGQQYQKQEEQLPQPAYSEDINAVIFDNFIEWFKKDWILKLGALLLLIAFGWLVTYAFLNNWIGPMGRIVIGITAGASILLLGWWRVQKYTHQGGIFLVLGSTIILISIFAARELYDFFTPLSALFVMFLSTAFVALMSVKYKIRWLSLISLALAGVAPLLTNDPSTNFIMIFAYLFVVIIGTIWIVAVTERRELTFAALLLVSLYSVPHFFSSPWAVDKELLLLFAYAFTALFFFTNTLGILKLQGKDIISDLVTAAGSGIFLLAWIMFIVKDEWKSLTIAAWMMVFSVGAFIIFKITQRKEPFYVYAGVSVIMLVAATFVQFKGAPLTIVYTIESAIISIIIYYVLKNIRIAEQASLFLFLPVILSIKSIIIMFENRNNDILSEDFFVLLILGITFLGLGTFFWLKRKANGEKLISEITSSLLVGGSAYLYLLLWLSLRAAFENNDLAAMISLVVYTIIGIATYLYGKTRERKMFLFYGAGLLGVVVLRLLLVDVWNMELTGRIITFFLIGILFISTAFLGRKKQ